MRALAGEVDESFAEQAVMCSPNKVLLLDLERVSRINSIGVRLWTQALAKRSYRDV